YRRAGDRRSSRACRPRPAPGVGAARRVRDRRARAPSSRPRRGCPRAARAVPRRCRRARAPARTVSLPPACLEPPRMTAYARATMDANQGGPIDEVRLPAEAPLLAAETSEAERLAAEARRRAADEIGGRAHNGLLWWAAIAFGGTAIAGLLRRSEVPLFLV